MAGHEKHFPECRVVLRVGNQAEETGSGILYDLLYGFEVGTKAFGGLSPHGGHPLN